ncbi:MAG: decaprenylphosphoryl-beta-D-ribose oxidase [Acidimicrobiaceae bacterium]|nr:MAG: decaprenylphosphoryl-beta-D-ribose oxidase [Acidimicrobiaceae bacterium]
MAWIDLAAKGRHLGRSALTRGDHARADQLGPKAAVDPLAYGPRQLISVPPVVPRPGLLNHASVAAFNELWYRKTPRDRRGGIQGIASFFHPLDMVGSWPRLYGRPGLVQYQFVVPFGQEEVMRRVIERVSASGAASFLAVLKRFGVANGAPLSFPQPGWTLALDMPGGARGLGNLLHGLRSGAGTRGWPSGRQCATESIPSTCGRAISAAVSPSPSSDRNQFMDNAFGQPQTIVVLGGTSDIGLAIARALITPVLRTVVLACRDAARGEAAAAALRDGTFEVEVVPFDIADTGTHVELVADLAARHGDLDVVVLAAGQLGDGAVVGADAEAAARLAHVNFTGAISASIATANRLRLQGHGTLVVLSSVAGERVRKANFVYGATKAGLDGFAQGLGDSLVGSGARTVKGLRSGRRTVWAPGILRFVFSALRHVPGPVWRRLPLG